MKPNDIIKLLFIDFKIHEIKIFLWIIFLFFIFFIFRIISNNFYLDDSYEYLEIARKFYNLEFFNLNSNISTKRPFVYPLFLSCFLDYNIIFTLLFQTIIGIVNIFFIIKIIKKFVKNIDYFFLAIVAFTPSIFIYTEIVMSESIVLFLITFLIWLLTKQFTLKIFAFIQIATVILAFIKPIFYPFIYINFIFFSIYLYKIKKFSFWLFFPIFVLQIYLNYNEEKTGYRHFSSIENDNLLKYNLYYFKASIFCDENPDKWLNFTYNQSDSKINFREQQLYLKKVAINEIKNNFFSYSTYHFLTSIRGVLDPGRFDLMTFFTREDGKQGFLEILNGRKSIFTIFKNKFAFVYLILIPIFAVTLFKWYFLLKYIFKTNLTLLISYISLLLFYHILVSGPVNCSRYMMPLQGIIIIFAFLGFKIKKQNT